MRSAETENIQNAGHRRRHGSPGHDHAGATPANRGQTVPLVAVMVWLAAGAALLVLHTSNQAVGRARSQTAADAAALAGAMDPNTADHLARANGSVVDGRDQRGSTFEVHVAGGSASARAAAVAPAPGVAGLDPRLVAALAAAEQLLGEPVPIVSGFRTREEQRRLWAAAASNPYPVARPGTSKHELGLAIDVPLVFVSRLRSVGPRVGVCQPLPTTDPVHFVLCAVTPTP